MPLLPTDPSTLTATAVLGLALLAIAIWDARTMRIPDFISLPLILAGIAAAWRLSALPLRDHLIGAAAGYLLLVGLAAFYKRARRREGLGRGDAKLLAASGAWLAWAALPTVLLIASFTGLAHALARGLLRRGAGDAGPMPFGPHLAFATGLVWLIGPIGTGPVWR